MTPSLDARADRLVGRAGRLAEITARPGGCTRLGFSASLHHAVEVYRRWLEELGMHCRTDAAGNLSAVLEGTDPEIPRLVLGSHLDTVTDGGRWDGPLGLLVAADCVEGLAARDARPACDVEIIAFADEEGARYGNGCFGSRALAGAVDAGELSLTDADGVSLAAALAAYTGGEGRIESVRRDPATLGAFLEVHIEQGPVLERASEPLGVVSAIAGNTRAELRYEGEAGHAGTVPMGARRDAAAAAAAWAVAVERRANAEAGLVGTVGVLCAESGQVNVIAGTARASLDVRGPDDAQRRRVVDELRQVAEQEARQRGVRVVWSQTLDRPAAAMSPGLVSRAQAVLGDVPLLVSGAGHDAAIMATLCPAAMVFVRCRGGVSHHPDEHVAVEDIRATLHATDLLLDDWLARWPAVLP